MKFLLIVGVVIVILDLMMTLFGRPLIGPGFLAKFMYKALDKDK